MATFPNLFSRNLNFIKAFANIKRGLLTSSIRSKKPMEQLEKNAYYEKYAEKIAKLQQTSPAEFLSRVDHLLEKKTPKPKVEQVTEGKFSQLLKPKRPLDRVEVTETQLDNVMKINLIQDKTSEEIKEIWHQYHIEKNFISAVIPGGDFEEMNTRGMEFPTFLFPLPRSQGYEFIMSQFERNVVHFTPLLYYQVHKENAPECLTITHYTELENTKNIVLMRGEYDMNIINLKEAQCLANQLQMYYVRPTSEKLKLLETFTRKPDEFKHMDLIKQVESLSL